MADTGTGKFVLKLSKSLWSKSETSSVDNINGNKNINKNKNFIVAEGRLSSIDQDDTNDNDDGDSVIVSPKVRPFDLTMSKSTKKVLPLDHFLANGKVLQYLDHLYSKVQSDQTKLLSTDITKDICDLDTAVGVDMLNYEEIYIHMKSLRIEHIQRMARPLLNKAMQNPRNLNTFNSPVDVVGLGIPEYNIKIKKPMDLGTVRSKLQRGFYQNISDCFSDISLVFKNAISFNGASTVISQSAKAIKDEFEAEVKHLENKCMKEMERRSNHSCTLCSGSSCPLCGEKCLKFEPPTLICYGTCCQRIKKNSVYYVSEDGLVIYCQKCFSNLPAVINKDMTSNDTVLKKDMLKRRSDEEVAEPWVHCDTCHHWMHQICALYTDCLPSDALDNGEQAKFECPMCRLEAISEKEGTAANNIKLELSSKKNVKGKNVKLLTPKASEMSMKAVSDNTTSDSEDQDDSDNSDKVSDIVKTEPTSIAAVISPVKLRDSKKINLRDHDAEYMAESENEDKKSRKRDRADSSDTSSECLDHESVLSASTKSKNSQWKAKDLPRTKLSDFLEGMVIDRLKATGFGDITSTITIRMVSNTEKHFEVPDVIHKNLQTEENNKVPQYMNYQQKCILLFQNIDGVDVCLFCLYVQEFDENCPAPNKSLVYIAYLDSVDYFRPLEARTTVYHEIIIAYLKWAQARGFKQGHIWSCPPQRGDNFIFWCHPSHQRIPSRDRLNNWYSSILRRASTLGVVSDIDNLFEKYFSKYHKKEEAKPKNSFTIASSDAWEKVNENLLRPSPLILPRTYSIGSCFGDDDLEAPICPPLFEGDYWVNESLNAYKSLSKNKNFGDSIEKTTNQRRCREILRSIMNKQIAYPFLRPVDHVALEIPDYPNVIKNPMDLGTIRENLRSNQYNTVLEFAKDVRLTFQNAITYNPAQHPINQNSLKLLAEFESHMADVVAEFGTIIESKDAIDNILSVYPLTDRLNSVTPKASNDGNDMDVEGEGDGDGEGRKRSASFVLGSPVSSIVIDRNCWSHDSRLVQVNKISPRGSGQSIASFGTLLEGQDEDRDSSDGEIMECRRMESLAEADIDINSWRPYNNGLKNSLTLNMSNLDYQVTPFEKPDLGLKGANNLMAELSKGVHHLKDDLFVFKFAPTASLNTRKKANTGKDKKEIKRTNPIGTEEISDHCMKLLRKVDPDLSDPDATFCTPFVDTRQTFLEMSQFLHLQFDSLRRAKHSSLMLLYHLHNPYSQHLRPNCSICKNKLVEMRWHCDQCPGYDICTSCNNDSANHHCHSLAPFRVSFQ